jgi:hypothetical protein
MVKILTHFALFDKKNCHSLGYIKQKSFAIFPCVK